MEKYILAPFSDKEEFEALTKDITEVLNKYNAEIGVKATIEISKRVEVTEDMHINEPVPSPYNENGDNSNTTEEAPEDQA